MSSVTQPEFFSAEEREQAIVQNLSFAERLAAREARKLGARDIIREELEREAVLGLVSAANDFDKGKSRETGAKFKSYAEYRIRGAMLDWMRKQDTMSRPLRKMFKDILREQNGTAGPESLEQAIENLPKVKPEMKSILKEAARRYLDGRAEMLSLDSRLDRGGVYGSFDTPSRERSAEAAAIEKDTVEKLLDGLHLGAREFITQYFLDETKPRELAKARGVSENRVSALKKSALNQLRERAACLGMDRER